MKIFSGLIVSAFILCAVDGLKHSSLRRLNTDDDSVYPMNLVTKSTGASYQMEPVRMIHARAQSDEPVWNETRKMFTSRYGGDEFEQKFRASLDTVNSASVEGGLMYVQAECIDYNQRSADEKCSRKNGVKYMVFYDIVMAQSNETLAQWESSEYGPMVPMDGGRCTPEDVDDDGKETLPKACHYFNGDNDEPSIGPFVGGEKKDTNVRAPYPNTWWFSFPNTCPQKGWGREKTDACREGTRQGLCDYDMMPNGVDCTFNYRILGYLPLDDLVGITSMQNSSSQNYEDFTAFCEDGKVEFKGDDSGNMTEGITFWSDPFNETANADRTTQMIEKYHELVDGTLSSTQVAEGAVQHMSKLLDVVGMAETNPACYKNIKTCSSGCKRSLYSQICTPCEPSTSDIDCKAAPQDFNFPELEKAKTKSGDTVSPTEAPTDSPTPEPTTATPAPSSASERNVAHLGVIASALLSVAGLVAMM